MLKAGDAAPDVTLRDAQGTVVQLTAFRGKPLVLYFYPKDETPGCTAQACGFRDDYAAFLEAGAQVAGVSSDGAASHVHFTERYKLPFPLLSDTDGAARAAFGVPKTFGVLPGRVTFVIDAAGVIRHTFDSQFMPRKHVREALNALRKLSR